MSTWTRERHEEARSIGFGFSFYEPGICELVADAVTEIERLRALTTITDDMVERLAMHQNDAHLTTWTFPWKRLSEEDKKAARAEARWALEAALTTKENEA